MFGLKSAYFYLVALQITFIKFFKKIYFSTGHYNNSLNSKIPIQVFFNPNPFLLSLISPYGKKSFNLSEMSPNDFWLEKKNKKILTIILSIKDCLLILLEDNISYIDIQ